MIYIQRLNEWHGDWHNSYPGGLKKYYADYDEAANVILDNGNFYNVSDYGLSCELGNIVSLTTYEDVNGVNTIWVTFDDDDIEMLDKIDDKDLTTKIFDILIY